MPRKYAGITGHLRARAEGGERQVTMTFGEIDRLVGDLPPSARRNRTWWGNGSNTQAIAWRDAGWHVGSVDLDLGRVCFEAGEVGGSYAARGLQPRSNPAVGAGLAPTGDGVEVALRFEWLNAGPIQLDADGKPSFRRLPARPGIYRLTLDGRSDQDRPLLYFGETDNLARRAGNYRNPGPSQKTSLRINARLREHIASGGSATLAVSTDVALLGEGAPVLLDLGKKAPRLLAENAALVIAQRSDLYEIENLG